jgi:hypothetical protein
MKLIDSTAKTNWKFLVGVLVIASIVVGVLVFLGPQFKIDKCLDHGGSWDYDNSYCITIPSTIENRALRFG